MMATRCTLCLTWTLFVTMLASRVLEARLMTTTRHLNHKNIFIEEEETESDIHFCHTDNFGNFGKRTSHIISILYQFEMEILDSAESSTILPAFEKTLNSLLLPNCFHECQPSGGKIKSTAYTRSRASDIIGISTAPEDSEIGRNQSGVNETLSLSKMVNIFMNTILAE